MWIRATRAVSRKLLPALSNYFRFGLTRSSYISVAVAHKATGNGMNHHNEDYLVKTTSGLVKFCRGNATFCQVTAYIYGSAAVWPKLSVNNIATNNDAGGNRVQLTVVIQYRTPSIVRRPNAAINPTPLKCESGMNFVSSGLWWVFCCIVFPCCRL